MLDATQFTNDLDNMLEDWGIATFTPKAFAHPSVNSVTLRGMFDKEYTDINGVLESYPTFFTKTSDVAAVAVDDNFTIDTAVLDTSLDGQNYKVKEFQHNGNNTTLLILERV